MEIGTEFMISGSGSAGGMRDGERKWVGPPERFAQLRPGAAAAARLERLGLRGWLVPEPLHGLAWRNPPSTAM